MLIGNKIIVPRRTNFPLTNINPANNSIAFATGKMYLDAMKPAISVAKSPVGSGCSPIRLKK